MPEMLNIALPKGRLGEKVYEIFESAGYPCPAIREKNRKLIFENPDAGVRYFWVKPSDVAIYVERGAADLGDCRPGHFVRIFSRCVRIGRFGNGQMPYGRCRAERFSG